MTTTHLDAGFIDVHHHAFLPCWLNALSRLGVSDAGGVRIPGWDAESDLALMDRHGIDAAMLSVSAPGVYFNDIGLARRLARECNEGLAGLVRTYPRRYGAFAVLPLPDVDAALKDLDYALDELKLDGIGLHTKGGRTLPG